MANRLFTSQFSFSFEKQLVKLIGAFTQVGSAGGRASLVAGDVTFTAKAWGDAGNAISVELLDPGAPSQPLAITITGDAISVSLATDAMGDISTDYGDLAVAMQTNIPALALVTVTGSSPTKVSPIAQTNLSGGADTAFQSNLPLPIMSLAQVDDGLFKLTLADKYLALLSANVSLMAAIEVDLQPQLKSEDVQVSKIIEIRTIAVGSGSPVLTNLSAGDKLLIELSLRNVT